MANKPWKDAPTSLVTKGNANHSHNGRHFTPTNIAISNRQGGQVNKSGENVETLEASCITVGMQNGAGAVETGGPLQKANCWHHMIKQFCTRRTLKRKDNLHPYKSLYSNTRKSQELQQSKCLLTHEQINQNVVHYTTGYHSALEMKEALIRAVMQMSLENTVKEARQKPKPTDCMFSFVWNVRIGKSIKIL